MQSLSTDATQPPARFIVTESGGESRRTRCAPQRRSRLSPQRVVARAALARSERPGHVPLVARRRRVVGRRSTVMVLTSLLLVSLAARRTRGSSSPHVREAGRYPLLDGRARPAC